MRKQVPAWQVGDRFFPTIQEAMKAELAGLFDLHDGPDSGNLAKVCADCVIEHSGEVIDILTDSPKSKAPRKPRKDRGTKRQPKDKNTPTLPAT